MSDDETAAKEPARASFLELLAWDINAHPERLHNIEPALVQRIEGLVAGISVDLSAPLLPGDE